MKSAPADRPFDLQEFLKTPEERAAMIETTVELDDPAALRAVLSEVAKAEGVAEMSPRTDLGE